LSNPEEFRRFQDAQNELTQALGQLRTVVENYPQLQSQARFADLMTALEGSENRINTARDRYNEAVRAYNTEIRTFPSIIGARVIHGAEPMVPFEASAAAQTAPTVPDNLGIAPPPGAPAPAANDNTAAPETPAAAAN
jgi:LemA protein